MDRTLLWQCAYRLQYRYDAPCNAVAFCTHSVRRGVDGIAPDRDPGLVAGRFARSHAPPEALTAHDLAHRRLQPEGREQQRRMRRRERRELLHVDHLHRLGGVLVHARPPAVYLVNDLHRKLIGLPPGAVHLVDEVCHLFFVNVIRRVGVVQREREQDEPALVQGAEGVHRRQEFAEVDFAAAILPVETEDQR